MSSIIVSEDGKRGRVTDGFFAYVRIKNPKNKYQSQEKEYSVAFIVDKKTAKEFRKKYAKISMKEYDNDVFKEKFHFDPPYPNQDEQYVLTFNTPEKLKGQVKPENLRPKVFQPVGDNKIKNITNEVNVGNGSSGDVAFYISNTEYGLITRLDGILVKNLVESKIEQKEGSSSYQNVFGEEVKNEVKQEKVTEPSEDLEEIPF